MHGPRLFARPSVVAARIAAVFVFHTIASFAFLKTKKPEMASVCFWHTSPFRLFFVPCPPGALLDRMRSFFARIATRGSIRWAQLPFSWPPQYSGKEGVEIPQGRALPQRALRPGSHTSGSLARPYNAQHPGRGRTGK